MERACADCGATDLDVVHHSTCATVHWTEAVAEIGKPPVEGCGILMSHLHISCSCGRCWTEVAEMPGPSGLLAR